jgi:hypothetical protein
VENASDAIISSEVNTFGEVIGDCYLGLGEWESAVRASGATGA